MSKNNKKLKYILIISLFAVAIFSFRFVWLKHFNETHELQVSDGEVYISKEELVDNQFQLVGDWVFYPNELIKERPANEEETGSLLHVPDDWSEAFEDNSVYGYGTYHLRIHLDADEEDSFALRMYSVRSASKVYANGSYVGHSGEVSSNKNDYEAFNTPYNTYSIVPDEEGTIDIFVQVANYTDPRAGGIIRSVYFGSEENIEATTYLSSSLQMFSGTIFFLHGIFALIIFFIGIRNREMLYFSLGLFTLSLITLNTGDEKIFLQFINMSYATSYKLAVTLTLTLALSLILTLKNAIGELNKKIVPIFSSILISLIIIGLVTPMNYLVYADLTIAVSVLITLILVIVSIIRTRKHYSGHIGFILATIAITNHIFWFGYTINQGIKSIYYPFDLIIAIICLSTIWFKHYYDMNIKMEKQTLQLAAADKEKDLFLANTAHELKNPLHSILNMSEAVLSREEGNLQHESKKDLSILFSVSQRMSMLVNDLLEASLLDEKKPTLYVRQTSLPGMIEGTIHLNEYLISRKNVEIINRVADDFPYVLADENRLTQIMYNLIHNAVKFTEEGTITVDAEVKGEQAVIRVSDTGIGIQQEKIPDLFAPYQQGSNENPSGGLGLGLYITKQLIEYMAGEIEVESVEGEGTTFTFTLPLANGQGSSEERSIVINDQLTSSAKTVFRNQDSLLEEVDQVIENERDEDLEKAKVIVIDDDPVNLRVIEVVLAQEFYEVTTVLSASEALEQLETTEYDLIISDVMMPYMSGFELTKEVRKRFTMSELPILLLTSRDRINDIKHGFDVGANDYVTKPIDAVELKSRVKALTDVARAARESLYLESAFLQAQIQPHFIFNAINSIMALSEIDTKRMQKLLEAFSEVLRSKFQFKDMKQFIPLQQELLLIEAYLYIEQVRFGDRMNVVWEVDDNINVKIPPITIQPLVENAVLHGVTSKSGGGTITIKVSRKESHIEISVADDGPGIPEHIRKRIENNKRAGDSGVGIYNTNLRLIRSFGKGLHIESEEGQGTKISFDIPVK